MLTTTILKTLKIRSLLWNILSFLEKQLQPSLASNNKLYQHQCPKLSIWQ